MSKNLYTEPMPSPNGTNFERLYIVRKPFAEAMAFDAAMPGAKFGGYGSGYDDPNNIDLDTPNSAGDDLRDQIYQLLAGKVDDASIEMLIKLIEGGDTDTTQAPVAAQDERMGRDQRLVMPSTASRWNASWPRVRRGVLIEC